MPKRMARVALKKLTFKFFTKKLTIIAIIKIYIINREFDSNPDININIEKYDGFIA
jgi:hypothetical protein